MKLQNTLRATIRINGKVEKRFDTVELAEAFAENILISHCGHKKESISISIERCFSPSKSHLHPLDVIFDRDERDIYQVIPSVYSDFYVELSFSHSPGFFYNQVNFASKEREVKFLRNKTDLSKINLVKKLPNSDISKYDFAGKILANI